MIEKQIDTIVTDMDGTLLLKKGDAIHPLNQEVLSEWQESGKKLFLATGRLDLAILPFIHALKIKLPVISCNGGLVRDFETGEILYKSDIELKKIAELLALLAPLEVDYHIYTTKRILGPSYTGKIAFFTEQNKQLPENEQVPLTVTQDPLAILDEGEFPLKLLIVEGDKAKQQQIKELLADSGMSVLSSAANLIDIMNEGIDKAKGLRFLAEKGYLDLSHTLAFGDNENDAGMIELAAIGVAMENGIAQAKEKADFIGLSNEEGGVGRFILDQL
ncbi:HAD family hydrolase [Listeria ilorinensis]|uniref:HAD family hydrolase n=1 Tax=Listeria ilorinensis TaxID=2867439 RepID=UPI001EF4323E|nr:HAD family hydrolase [Listeria ilorinensis]